MAIVALGLLIGQQGKTALKTALPVFLLSVFIALALTRILGRFNYPSELILLSLSVTLGLLVIVKLKLNSVLVISLSLLTALMIGFDSAVTGIPGLTAGKVYLQLLGTGVSASFLLMTIALLSLVLNKLWEGIAVRVLGAWVTAGSLMVLALLLHALVKSPH